MKYTGAEIIIKLLERQGIKIISGIPGGSNLPIYNALYESKIIKHVLARHEQGAGFIAQGIARITGKAGVCFATSGPGVMNLLSAIADAKLDSIPLVAITGQISYSLVGSDAFQEVDAYGLTLPITKHNFMVRSIKELLDIIPEAFSIAESGRPGPVIIDIPKDIQLDVLEIDEWPEPGGKIKDTNMDSDLIKRASKMINSSKKPVLYVGGGIINSNASEVLIELAKKNSIPVASTLMGLGCLPPEDPLNLGLIGMHGERSTNYILDEADLLLAFGVRFDDRAIGNASKFCKRASIIHIDIDPAEINKIKKASLSIIGDAQEILKKLIPLVESDKRELWVKKVNSIKRAYPPCEPNPEDIFHPINFIKKIGKMAKANTVVTTDVGQHQMWVAKSYPFSSPKTLLTSGGLGTMGFGLPSAIGAALANPDGQVICFSGDGSFLMNLQELATLSDLKLNVKIFILNNGHLGLVRQLQEMFYSKNYIACKFDTNPNFAVISQGFGIKGYDLNEEENPDEILNKILTEPGPCVVNVHVPFTENVLPIVPPGAPNYEMLGGDIND